MKRYGARPILLTALRQPAPRAGVGMKVRFLALPVLIVAFVASAPSATAAPPLRLGFLDDVQTGTAETSAPWLQRAVASSADVARISNSWGTVAPTRPSDPTNPADPAYNWGGLDQAVRGVAAAGLDPFVALTGAPAWAEGPNRPSTAEPGSWRPNATAFAAFAEALGRRYDGTYPDPERVGALLPRVRSFAPWNEPNLAIYLAPQWARRSGRFVNSGPAIYRDLLNGFYHGIKASQPAATVVAGLTAPFGDPDPGGRRTMPARFVRTLLCLDIKLRTTCRNTARFDAIAHHPYSVGSPTRKTLNRDDVSIADLARITRPVAAAVRRGRALPRRAKPLWITEISYDSSPPDPNGLPVALQARYLQQAFASLYRQGARVITWFQIRDQAPVPSFAATNQSGVYFRDGRPKPSQKAFAFPLVVTSTTATRARLFLRAPAAGTVQIERLVDGRWEPAGSIGAGRHAVVQRSVARGGATAFRARQGGATSLSWRLG